MPIYQATTKLLHEIIKDASDGRMMVPDIQRAYVWTPDKIIRLIDTFLKGWPFSTLLLWDTGLTNNANTLVPHRPFKARVSRVEDGGDEGRERNLSAANLPGNITMILDGQQRIQSVLIAFSGHDAGLYLRDKDWYSSFSDDGEHPYRGNAVNSRWCYGQLYLNLAELINHLDAGPRGTYSLRRSTDWTKIFSWAIPDENDGVGYGGPLRNESYKWPIDRLAEKNLGSGRNRFVHSSHLWRVSEGFKHQDDNRKWTSVETFLDEQLANIWDSEVELAKIQYAIFGLLNLFSSLREERISCLQLQTQTAAGYDDNFPDYSEAVVNIFNRLNAAGMALGKDEITSSWIRNSWEQLPSNGIRGAKIYAEINKNFTYEFKQLDDQNIVKILNILWAVFDSRDGKDSCRLFSDSDLLAGGPVKEMTVWVHQNWSLINSALSSVSDFLINSRLKFNYHFKSVNLIYCMVVYRFGLELCISSQNLTPAERSTVQVSFQQDTINWLLTTLFASKWGKNSDSDLAKFMDDSYKWLKANQQINNWEKSQSWREIFLKFIDFDSRISAKKYVENFETSGQYTIARTIFFAWNQFPDRCSYYGTESMVEPTLDHIISQVSWEKALKIFGLQDNEEYVQCIHDIGNLNELGRVDNSRKNANPLSVWLTNSNQDQNKIRQAELIRICELFSISETLSSPNLDTIDEINNVVSAIRERTLLIKQNVIDLLQLN